MKDLTQAMQEALAFGRCTILHRSSVFLTDRPENRGLKGFKGSKGDSDVEAGHAFDILKLVETLSPRYNKIFASLNNIRIFGPISARNFLHFHGYSRSQRNTNPNQFHCIILTVHAVAPYDITTKQIDQSKRVEELIVNGRPGVIFLYEDEERIRFEPLRVGDMIVLPSGAYHSFAAAPGVFASYGAIEMCDDPSYMYQAHYEQAGRDPFEIIAKTVCDLTGNDVTQKEKLTLRDIPGLDLYVETRDDADVEP